MSALKRKIARGSVGGKQSDKGKAAADSAAPVPRKAARRINLGRAGLYDDKTVPETSQGGVSADFEHRVVRLSTGFQFFRLVTAVHGLCRRGRKPFGACKQASLRASFLVP